MPVAILALLAITFLWLCYWMLIRPVILDSVDDEIRRLRSRLEWAMIEGDTGSQSEAAQRLLIKLSFSAARWISFSQAVTVAVINNSEMKSTAAKDRSLFESAPQWIREISYRLGQLNLKAALANSPLWWLPLSLILLVSIFSRKTEQWINETAIALDKLRSTRARQA